MFTPITGNKVFVTRSVSLEKRPESGDSTYRQIQCGNILTVDEVFCREDGCILVTMKENVCNGVIFYNTSNYLQDEKELDENEILAWNNNESF